VVDILRETAPRWRNTVSLLLLPNGGRTIALKGTTHAGSIAARAGDPAEKEKVAVAIPHLDVF